MVPGLRGVASVVNAIGNSSYWANTAISSQWDHRGGWCDHVAPPTPFVNSHELGFRVPLIVVSPYAKPAYISHATHDFGSIQFFERTFGLPVIAPGAGYADECADDFSDCHDFNQTPPTGPDDD
jgi:phospholipase C